MPESKWGKILKTKQRTKSMKTEESKSEPQQEQLYLPDFRRRYICKVCKTEHFLMDLIYVDNGWDYTFSCKNCGDVMESNGKYYW